MFRLYCLISAEAVCNALQLAVLLMPVRVNFSSDPWSVFSSLLTAELLASADSKLSVYVTGLRCLSSLPIAAT